MTHDYKRNGSTTLFAALNMLDGTVIVACMPRHRHREVVHFLKLIDAQTPADLDLHLIVDNYATQTPSVKRWLKAHFLVQHGGAFLCRDHPKPHPPRGLQKRRRTQERHHGIPGKSQCRPQAFHLDQVCGRNPRKSRPCETSVRVTRLVERFQNSNHMEPSEFPHFAVRSPQQQSENAAETDRFSCLFNQQIDFGRGRLRELLEIGSIRQTWRMLLHAVASKILDYLCLDCLCRRDIGIAGGVAFLELGKAASIQRACKSRIEA